MTMLNVDEPQGKFSLNIDDYQPIQTSEQNMKGILRISEQHERILVARKDGKVEHQVTLDLGFKVGLEADIHNFVSQKEIHLQSDDVVVLYTDGITEASIRLDLNMDSNGLVQINQL